MKKVIKLTESELTQHIQKIISEQSTQLAPKELMGNKPKLPNVPVKKNQSKEYLIQVLTDKLNRMKSDPKWLAQDVAQTIINNCNNFLGKEDIFNEQLEPDHSKGTVDMNARGDKYLPLTQKLAKQLKEMKFSFNGKNIFTNTFDGYHVVVEFSNQGVKISKQLEKKVDTPNMQAPLVLPYEKINEMNFMKHIVDYVRGMKSSVNEVEGSKRPHDKMVKDCLMKAGFKVGNTSGKYDLYMFKDTKGGTSTITYVVSSQKDPTKFSTNTLRDGKVESSGSFQIGTSTNCKQIVDDATNWA